MVRPENIKGGEILAESYRVDIMELRKAGLEHGLVKVSEWSEKTRIDRNTMGEILSGKTYPSSSAMQRIVDALQMKADRAGRIFFAPKLT